MALEFVYLLALYSNYYVKRIKSVNQQFSILTTRLWGILWKEINALNFKRTWWCGCIRGCICVLFFKFKEVFLLHFECVHVDEQIRADSLAAFVRLCISVKLQADWRMRRRAVKWEKMIMNGKEEKEDKPDGVGGGYFWRDGVESGIWRRRNRLRGKLKMGLGLCLKCGDR